MSHDLLTLPVSALTARYRSLSLSPVEIARLHFARIEALESRLNAFQLIDANGAFVMARASEARWRAGAPLSAIDAQRFAHHPRYAGHR